MRACGKCGDPTPVRLGRQGWCPDCMARDYELRSAAYDAIKRAEAKKRHPAKGRRRHHRIHWPLPVEYLGHQED
jgi:hypothetical protein